MEINENDVKFIEKAIAVRNKGMYVNSNELTTVYNRVLEKNRRPTSCGQCLRAMVNELEVALNAYKRLQEALKNNGLDSTPSGENKPLTEANAGENKPKKVGRPKKE